MALHLPVDEPGRLDQVLRLSLVVVYLSGRGGDTGRTLSVTNLARKLLHDAHDDESRAPTDVILPASSVSSMAASALAVSPPSIPAMVSTAARTMLSCACAEISTAASSWNRYACRSAGGERLRAPAHTPCHLRKVTRCSKVGMASKSSAGPQSFLLPFLDDGCLGFLPGWADPREIGRAHV